MRDADKPEMSRRDPLRRDTNRPVQLQERDAQIIDHLFRFHVATRSQIQTHFDLSLHRANRVLRRLYDAELVERHVPLLPDLSPYSGQMIYGPGRGAAEMLSRRFGEDAALIKRRCDKLPGYLAHALLVSEIASGAARELKSLGASFAPLLVERMAIDSYEIRGKNGAWKRQIVRPDALVPACVVTNKATWHIAIECDRGTVAAKPLIEKLVGFKMWARSGAMNQVHGSGKLAILIYTYGEERRKNLLSYARQVFTEPGCPLFAVSLCGGHPAPLMAADVWQMHGKQETASVYDALREDGKENKC